MNRGVPTKNFTVMLKHQQTLALETNFSKLKLYFTRNTSKEQIE